MKVIIPLAGKGTRLRPHTHVTPKPMLHVAGKPVMAYILEDLERLGDVEQIIYITGHLKDKVEEYARARIPHPVGLHRAGRAGRDGRRGGARARVRRPAGPDHLRRHHLRRRSGVVHRTDADGIIWVKEVEDYQRFGVVVTDAGGNMTRIVEKPETPISKRANIGLYYVRNWKLLFEGIDWVLSSRRTRASIS